MISLPYAIDQTQKSEGNPYTGLIETIYTALSDIVVRNVFLQFFHQTYLLNALAKSILGRNVREI